MSKPIRKGTPAPVFILEDFEGNKIRLSEFFGQRNVVLVFNRGFI